MVAASGVLEMIASTLKRNNMRSAKKVKNRLSGAVGIFLEWLYGTIVLLGVLGVFMIGAVSVASMANSLRMTGYLDTLFGMYTLVSVYVLIWLPVFVLVYFYKQE